MSLRTYAAKKAGIHMSAHHLPCLQTTLYISSYSRSVEYIPVGSVDTKIEGAGSSAIVSLEERWGSGRYRDWSSISHKDLRQNGRQKIEGDG